MGVSPPEFWLDRQTKFVMEGAYGNLWPVFHTLEWVKHPINLGVFNLPFILSTILMLGVSDEYPYEYMTQIIS